MIPGHLGGGWGEGREKRRERPEHSGPMDLEPAGKLGEKVGDPPRGSPTRA